MYVQSLRIPDLTKNVPHILSVNVVIDKIITQEVKINFFSKTKNTVQKCC